MSKLQHPDSRSFELVADLYERSRPGYPREAVGWVARRLDLRAGRTVLDLGAGTGKLTRTLVETGASVLAVEPGDAMRAELELAVPEAESLRGSAEEIPIPDTSVDAITVGQAFHWFRHDEAIPELYRVLRPRCGIALLWNTRDRESPIQRAVSELIAPFAPPGRQPAPDSSRGIAASELFGPVEERRFPFEQELDADGLVKRIASISFVAAAAEDRRAALEQELRRVVASSEGTVSFPYVTEVYVSFAVD